MECYGIRYDTLHRTLRPNMQTWATRSSGAKRGGSTVKPRSPNIVTIESDGSNLWKLHQIADLIMDGQVGVIPTDTYPALVCDLENRQAIKTLYTLKGASPSKKLSILVRNMSDISEYTMGFPASTRPGEPDFYKIAKRILPGPYTFIMNASKALPKQITDFDSGKSKKRATVGVRLVDNIACQEILSQLPRPLLCSSAIPTENRNDDGSTDTRIPDPVTLWDYYDGMAGGGLLSFVVSMQHGDWNDDGPAMSQPSTVVDLSGSSIEMIRAGKGDLSWLGE